MVFCVCVVVVSSPLSFRDCHGVHGVHIPLDKGAFCARRPPFMSSNALVTHFHVVTPQERRLSVPCFRFRSLTTVMRVIPFFCSFPVSVKTWRSASPPRVAHLCENRLILWRVRLPLHITADGSCCQQDPTTRDVSLPFSTVCC